MGMLVAAAAGPERREAVPGAGLVRGLVAIWSEQRAEAAAAAFAVARLRGESGTSRPLSPSPGP